MHLHDFLEVAPSYVLRQQSILLESSPGIGKSTVIENDLIAKMNEITGNDWACITVMLSQMEASDVGGFKVPVKLDDGTMVTVSSVPEIIRLVHTTGTDYGILFADERNNAGLDVLRAWTTVTLDGRAGQERLPPNWTVVAATNRLSDKSGVTKPPMHLINREVTFAIEFSLPHWKAYARAEGIHPLLITFADMKPGLIASDCVPAEAKPYPTPRSYTAACFDLIALCETFNVPSLDKLDMQPLILECLEGRVGKATAIELVGFLKIAKELFPWSTLVTDPDSVTIPTDKATGARRMDIAHTYLNLILHNIPNTTDQTELANLFRFITTKLPKEFQVALIKGASDLTDGRLLASSAFRKWVVENKSLVHATMGA